MKYTSQRRSGRLLRTITLTVSAVASDGRTVEGAAETLVLAKNGARIHTNLPLLLGSTVKITITSTGRQADAMVTWASRESPYEFGLELLRETDFWGNKFS